MRDELIKEGNERDMHPSDLADRLERIDTDSAREALQQLPASQVALALAELDATQAANLLQEFSAEQIASWLRLLPSPVIADLAYALPPELRFGVLASLPPEQSKQTTALLIYSPDSAGGIMDNRFIAVHSENTVEECLNGLRASSDKRVDDVRYIFVTDGEGRLVGVLSLRELVFAPKESRISDIMIRDVRFLRVHDDKEEIARNIRHYHYLGLPVVDAQGRLVGIVKVRDAIRIAEVEATEDMQLMVGLSGEERIWTPWRQSIRKRMPWLGVNLLTAFGAASVVSIFESTVARWTALVAFLPLICAVAGNAGNQALTVVIRSLALGEVTPGDGARALKKELFIGIANGSALATAIGLIAFAWKGSLLLGIVAGAAMWLNQIIGAVSGVAIPFVLRWAKVDPALASSILVTAVTDTMGFLVFLGTAAFAIQIFSP
ncbi:MAG: magnesium transporter [Verrucomicrobiales bacterium]